MNSTKQWGIFLANLKSKRRSHHKRLTMDYPAALFADENKDAGGQRYNVQQENGWQTNHGLAASSIAIFFSALSTKLFSITGHWSYALPPFFRSAAVNPVGDRSSP
jgi:hypothetical protein